MQCGSYHVYHVNHVTEVYEPVYSAIRILDLAEGHWQRHGEQCATQPKTMHNMARSILRLRL